MLRAALVLLAAGPLAAQAARPNVLVVFTDDHACRAVSAYGGGLNRTPNIDRLARDGVLFRNAFVTNSICAPSRAVLLTGRHSHRNGQFTNAETFDGAQPTFPKLLQAAGYQTALIGKWHLVSAPTGFDHWQVLVGQGTYYNPRLISAGGTEVAAGYTTDLLTDRALVWLRQRDPARPFLLMVQHKAPHREWLPAVRHLGLYADAELPEPATLFDDWRGRASGAAAQSMRIDRDLGPLDLKLELPRNLDAETRAALAAAFARENEALAAAADARAAARARYQRYLKDYLRCVAAVDESVGRLLDWLEDSGLADDTVVVYASDQGFYLGEHGWYDKRWMYEESLRFPLLVRWPAGGGAGREERRFVQNLDLAPTLLELAGVPVPADLQGRSLVPLLRGDAPADWRRSVYYHYWEHPGPHDVPRHYGVRTERHKLIRYYQLDAWELFDLERDPHELRSVYGEPAYAAVQAELERELRALQADAGDDEPHRLLPHQQRALAAGTGGAPTEVLRAGDASAAPAVRPKVAGQPLTVGARCTLRGPGGVVLAHGGERSGYALYFRDGVPRFAVRDRGRCVEIAGAKLPAGVPVVVQATLDAAGALRLYVDGDEVARGQGALLGTEPAEGLALGRDPRTAVGDYAGDNPFAGELADLRIYLGVLGAAELAAWAGR